MGSDETVEGGVRDSGSGLRVSGVVVKERPALVFEVVLDTQQRVLAHTVGQAAKNFVRLVPGDRVEVELSPHDPGRGKILKKMS